MKANKKKVFFGTATALVTPFRDGNIDYAALSRLIDIQIDAGVPALVIGGTTGEAATLSDDERYELYRFAKECIRGRARLILGTGTNDTRVAIKHTKVAESLRADGALLVTPYYNKGTEEGIFRHYTAIADECDIPLILYNVPSRTGVNLGLGLLSRLSERENIVAIKEASDSVDRLVDLSRLSDSLTLYSGNDSQIYPTLALGGSGVISVASNVFPREVCAICELYKNGRVGESLKMQQKIIPLCKALFAETNPAPVKYAMAKLGLISDELRLPLAPPRESTRALIDAALWDMQK
ncbi:MAG: 4-hydroxy-tetrahydrodipicolinate synthase [Clostridia bacterium]|nr:4-hydroxy-tetrahydrodipicolinate synthase [Clostridia bacterium]